jgi:hypothetical protein
VQQHLHSLQHLLLLDVQAAGLKVITSSSQISWGLAAHTRLWSSSAETSQSQSSGSVAKQLEEVGCFIIIQT